MDWTGNIRTPENKSEPSWKPLGRGCMDSTGLSCTKMLGAFRVSLHTKLFSFLDLSHRGRRPRPCIDPAVSSACGQGVTRAAQSFIPTNLREMVLWQEQAEEAPGLGGGQRRVQLPGAVNGFTPSWQQLRSGLCCCSCCWFSVTPFPSWHPSATSAGPQKGSAVNVVSIYTSVCTVKKKKKSLVLCACSSICQQDVSCTADRF